AGRVSHEVGLVLRGLPRQKAVEVLEPEPGGPVVVRTGGGRLVRGRVVPLAERARRVAVVAQDLRQRRSLARDEAGVAVPVVSELGDLAGPDAVLVASGQQRGPGGRA